MLTFSIKELETFSGIKAHTIRTWEQRFNFLQPRRSEGLRRLYTLEELRLLLDASLLNRNGFKVSAIARLSREDMNGRLASLTETHQRKDMAVNQLIFAMAAMDAVAFETVLESCSLSWDIDVVIAQVIIPFIKKTGLLAGPSARPNLVLIEQTIKQKIILGIEEAGRLQKETAVLFFLTRKHTDTELLLLQYHMRVAGFTTFYITTPISANTLMDIAHATHPHYVVSSKAGRVGPFNKDQFVHHLAAELPATHFINLQQSWQPESGTTADEFHTQLLQLAGRDIQLA